MPAYRQAWIMAGTGLYGILSLSLVVPADLIKHFFIDRLPVNRFAFGFQFFDHSLDHLSLDYLLA